MCSGIGSDTRKEFNVAGFALQIYISCGEVSTGNSESLILTHARFLGLGLGFGSKPKQHHSTRTAAAPKLASYGQNINIASILGFWSTQAYNSDDV